MANFYWQLKEFSEKIGMHRNTVDKWFKDLEETKIHYVTRNSTGERLFDEDDLKIANFIVDKRTKKWSLPSIFEELVNDREITLRLFPEDFLHEEKPVKYEDMRLALAAEMDRILLARMPELLPDFLPGALRSLQDPEREKREKAEMLLTKRRIERALEEEAIKIWEQKPLSERLIKTGLFRKEEDRDRRDRFIKDYTDQHYEDRVLKEFDIE